MNDNDNEKWNIQHRQTIIEGKAVTVDKNEWKFISFFFVFCVYVHSKWHYDTGWETCRMWMNDGMWNEIMNLFMIMYVNNFSVIFEDVWKEIKKNSGNFHDLLNCNFITFDSILQWEIKMCYFTSTFSFLFDAWFIGTKICIFYETFWKLLFLSLYMAFLQIYESMNDPKI